MRVCTAHSTHEPSVSVCVVALESNKIANGETHLLSVLFLFSVLPHVLLRIRFTCTKCHSCHSSCFSTAFIFHTFHLMWEADTHIHSIWHNNIRWSLQNPLRLCISCCVCARRSVRLLAELNISDSHAFVMNFVRIFYLICIFGLSNINYTYAFGLWKFELRIFFFSSVQTRRIAKRNKITDPSGNNI